MNLDKSKILRILTISAIFLILMLAFQWYLGKNVKVKALESVLIEHKNVENVKITEERQKFIIYLTFDNIDNFMEIYKDLYDSLEQRLKGQSFELKIVNKANSELEDIYYNKVQYIIYEALKTGEFTKMRARLDELEKTVTENSTSGPLKIQVFLDSEKLYLDMQLDDVHYFTVIDQEM